MGRECSMHRRDEKFIQNLVRKCEGKRSYGRPMYCWKDNIKNGYDGIRE
jgi:hypothetical protein